MIDLAERVWKSVNVTASFPRKGTCGFNCRLCKRYEAAWANCKIRIPR